MELQNSPPRMRPSMEAPREQPEKDQEPTTAARLVPAPGTPFQSGERAQRQAWTSPLLARRGTAGLQARPLPRHYYYTIHASGGYEG